MKLKSKTLEQIVIAAAYFIVGYALICLGFLASIFIKDLIGSVLLFIGFCCVYLSMQIYKEELL